MSRRPQRSLATAIERAAARPSDDTGISTETVRVGARGGEVVEHEVIADPARILRTMSRLCADEARGVLRSSAYPHPTAVRIARVQPARPLPLALDAGGASAGGDVEVQLFGPTSVYRFSAERCEPSAGLLATSMPRALVRQRRRLARRVAVHGVRVAFAHPDRPSVRIERAVLDASIGGLALRVGRHDGLAPGRELEIAIDWQERARVLVRGVVRHVSPDLDGTGEVAGVELAIEDDEDGARWRRLVGGLLWPTTIADGTYARDVWECLVDSGYCNLSDKSVDDFRDLREAYVGATRAIATRPDVGVQLVIPSGRGVEGTLSTLRIYDRAHFLYAVAKQPGRTPRWTQGRRILRDLYLHGVERLEADPSARWLVVWVQAQAEFTRFVHHEISRRYAPSGRSLVFRVDVMEAEDVVRAPVPEAIGAARESEVARVLAHLGASCSPIYLDALDLVPERFELRGLAAAWSRAGLARERAMLVAREDGEVVAAAVVELASEGLHLFRLFDAVRTYVVRAGGERHVPALLAGARAWFDERRKPTFVYVREDLAVPAPAGFRSLAMTDVTIFPRELLAELVEHVHDLTASPLDSPPAR